MRLDWRNVRAGSRLVRGAARDPYVGGADPRAGAHDAGGNGPAALDHADVTERVELKPTELPGISP
jgi:hypothetical protein